MPRVAVLPGDGIGPEIMREAVKVLKSVCKEAGRPMEFEEGLIGGAAYDAKGKALPDETLELVRSSDAVLLGAIGGPKWDSLPSNERLEIAGLLKLRKELNAFANLRPAFLFPALAGASTLKDSVVSGIDILVVRELTGGIYFGEPRLREAIPGGERAVDTLVYTSQEIERVVRLAFEFARKRRKKVTSVDKANVLESSRLWRDVAMKVASEYPDVEFGNMLVDNCAMQLVRNPRQFDVIVTENMFGDILSDEAAMLTGSLGMLASASLGGKIGLYEPVHGSAPDIAGMGKANPIATILSGAMMLRYSFDMDKEADRIEKAVERVLDRGCRTQDILSEGGKLVSTEEMGDQILSALKEV